MKFDNRVTVFIILICFFIWITDAVLYYIFISEINFWDLLIINVQPHVLYFLIFGSIILGYAKKQEKMKEELMDFEFKYKTVIATTNNWEFWKNAEGGYHYVTPAFERITGFLVEDLIQKPSLIKTIIYPDDLERVIKHLEDETNNTLEISEMEFRIVTQNKEVKKIRHSCQSVYDKNGKFMGARGSNVEVLKYNLVSDELLFKEAMISVFKPKEEDNIKIRHLPHSFLLSQQNKIYQDIFLLISHLDFSYPRNLLYIKNL
ncbi:MAG: PAS domain-containing protein [Bacteroidetes bacterium]|nr:PAS domain-containing protein [Bacteroidota bacterium]